MSSLFIYFIPTDFPSLAVRQEQVSLPDRGACWRISHVPCLRNNFVFPIGILVTVGLVPTLWPLDPTDYSRPVVFDWWWGIFYSFNNFAAWTTPPCQTNDEGSREGVAIGDHSSDPVERSVWLLRAADLQTSGIYRVLLHFPLLTTWGGMAPVSGTWPKMND